ncbi:AfsR/SARP family transcriptional regulator [Actinomadura sp. HBU206391]|uniref:AfsR/SARP family transcriptional regulator n=1 Tax=Actinomadura sp. HBU206391 TaxID=2731692 RepID=UPI00164EE1BF|nr:AfsR/SARP family transcriptional regulator [Actinomadura sp. HBU206391]MBC6462022.1 winged helix-turn-helix domain-containing protein [Actinomadura sp. HBU206391]
MEFRVLGTLQVSRDGTPVVLGAAMLRRLLATLLCRPGRHVPADGLIRALWEGTPPESARKTLQVYVHRLRQALDENGRIVHEAGGYAAVVSSAELDALRFTELVAAGRAARGRGQPETARTRLEQALALWQGAAYADIEGVQLVADEVRRLDEERLFAHEELAAANLTLGRHAEMVPGLAETANLHPYRERLVAYLMIALCGAGRQVDALEIYQRTRATLRDELGVEPGQLLTRVHQAVLKDGEAASAVGELLGPTGHGGGAEQISIGRAPSGRAGNVPEPRPRPPGEGPARQIADVGGTGPPDRAAIAPCHLPPDIIDFTGRDRQVASLCGLLSDAGASTATVVATVAGQAGVGKTTLAVHVAHRLRETFTDGQLYVDLHGTEARPADTREVLGRFLMALGVAGPELPEGLEERAGLFRAMLADRRVLVVLDNAADERQVRPLLPGGRGCAVLVTGRRKLAGLSAHAMRLDVLDPRTARELLARIAGPDRVVAEPAAAAEIVDLCAHLPLAVRIAAARLTTREHWSLEHLADRLRHERQRLDELAVGDLSVRAGLAMSYGALGADAKRAFRLLSLLDAPDFAVWTAAAVLDVTAGEAEVHVNELVDNELLGPARGDGPQRYRYRLHDLVRLYARECAETVETPDQRIQAITRALGAWLAMAEAADAELTERVASGLRGVAPRWHRAPLPASTSETDALAWFDGERLALRASVSQACEAGLDELAWELADRAMNYYAHRGLYGDWTYTHGLALRACTRARNRWGEAVMARDLAFLRMTGVPVPGHSPDHSAASLSTFQESGERHGTVDMLTLGAFAVRHHGDLDRTLALMNEAMPVAELIGYELGQCRLWYLRAVIHRERGRHEEAAECAGRSLGMAARAGTPHDQVLALWELAGACRDRESFRVTGRRLRDLLKICRHRKQRLLEAYLLLSLTELRLRFEEASPAEPIEWALAVFEEHSVTFGQAVGLRLLGESRLLDGGPGRAIPCLTEAVRIARGLSNAHELAIALKALGRAHRAAGNDTAARHSWREAERLFTRIANEAEAAEVAELRGRTHALK